VANATFSGFGIPLWAYRFVVLMVMLGFPISLIIAWAFELTPDGITKSSATPLALAKEESAAHRKKRRWVSTAFATAMPTLIFGTLALFFYFKSSHSGRPLTEDGSTVAGEQQIASIAVLPLINMSHQEENEYFAGGVHEDILTNLSRIETLSVVSRTTMLRYATSDLTISEIGEALDVDFIVEGSVRRIGDHVRVTIQLNHARDDRHLWANNFEREVVDEFATQSELAGVISSSLHLEIQPETVGQLDNLPTTSVKAYDLYLQAKNLEKTMAESPEQLLQIRDLLSRSVEEDADFVEAWAFLKLKCDHILNNTKSINNFIKSEFRRLVPDLEVFRDHLQSESDRSLAKAKALDPDNVDTLLAMAVNFNWPQPENILAEQRALFDRILAIDPEHAKAWYHLGWWYRKKTEPDFASSFAAFEKALEYDPFNARIVRRVLDLYRSDGDQEAVTRLNQRLVQILPETANDRWLARTRIEVHTFMLRFRENPNDSIIQEIETYINERRKGHIDGLQLNLSLTDLAFLKNDEQSILAFADTYTIGDVVQLENEWGSHQRTDLFLKAFMILINQELTEETEIMAHRILQFAEDPTQREGLMRNQQGILLLFFANLTTGQLENAQAILDIMESKPDFGLSYRTALAFVDIEKAVAEELKVLRMLEGKIFSNRAHGYCDARAFFHLRGRRLLAHPDIQAFYVKQGKWIPFLSERIPEYAQYSAE
jgi:TolB-like protein